MKLEYKDKVLLLLNALPNIFKHFKNTLLFEEEQIITLEEI